MAYKIQYGAQPLRKKISLKLIPALLLVLAAAARLMYPQIVIAVQERLFAPETVQAVSQLLADEAYIGDAVSVFCEEIFHSVP